MTYLVRIILGLLFLGCIFGTFFVFQHKEKQQKSKKIRFQEFEVLGLSEITTTLETLKELYVGKDLSYEEKKLFAELLIDHPNYPYNGEVLTSLITESPDDPDLLVLAECQNFKEGNFTKALDKLRKLVELHPNNVSAKFEFHKRAFTFLSIEDRIVSKQALQDLGRRSDRWGYKSLQVLCFSMPKTGYLKDDILESIDKLQYHPLVTSIDFLKGCEIKFSLLDNYGVAQFNEDVERVLGDRVKIEDYGSWLIRFNQPQKALSTVSKELAQKNTQAFFVRLMGLLQLGKMTEAKTLIDHVKNTFSTEDLYLAGIYLDLAMGKDGVIQNALKKNNLHYSSGSFLDLARLAILKGQGDEALEAFNSAWALKPDEFTNAQANQYLQLVLASKQTKKALSITQSLYDRFPFKLGNVNNLCYLSLIQGVNVIWASEKIRKINSLIPNNPAFLSTLALANLLSGKPEQALKDMQKRGIPQLVHSERAILAVIFHQLGDKERAEKMATTVSFQRLLPEELKLLLDHNLVASQ